MIKPGVSGFSAEESSWFVGFLVDQFLFTNTSFYKPITEPHRNRYNLFDELVHVSVQYIRRTF